MWQHLTSRLDVFCGKFFKLTMYYVNFSLLQGVNGFDHSNGYSANSHLPHRQLGSVLQEIALHEMLITCQMLMKHESYVLTDKNNNI